MTRHVFIVDELNYWTLTYYRRLKCRYADVHLVAFDPIWRKYTSGPSIFIDQNLVIKSEVILDKEIIKNTNFNSYDLAQSTNFIPDANTEYSVSFQYSVNSKENKKAIISLNFFGEPHDFEQVHLPLDFTKTWSQIETSLKTGHFNFGEKVCLRFWPRLSDENVSIRIHGVALSKQPIARNDISSYIKEDDLLHVFFNDAMFEDLETWILKTFHNAKLLSSEDLYLCSFSPQDNPVQAQCLESHEPQRTDICAILDASHEEQRPISVQGKKIYGSNYILDVKWDIEASKNAFLLFPVTISYSEQLAIGISAVGSPDIISALKKSKTRLPITQYLTFKDSPTTSIVLITDSLDQQSTREFIIKCWAKGVVLLTAVPLPHDLRHSPIISITLDKLNDILENEKLEKRTRELGFLAAQARTFSRIKEDLELLIKNHEK